MIRGRSLLCWLGLHQWYCDSAIFSSVDRCSRCSAVKDEDAAKRLDQERRLWEKERGSEDIEKSMGRVYSQLLKPKEG